MTELSKISLELEEISEVVEVLNSFSTISQELLEVSYIKGLLEGVSTIELCEC